MTEVTVSGKSIQEALQSALKTLNTSEDKVNVEIIEEPKKGFLGLLGSKPATIKVTLIEPSSEVKALEPTIEEEPSPIESKVNVNEPTVDPIEKATEYLKDITIKMGIDIDVEVKRVDNRNYEMKIIGNKMGILIGKRGQTLNAFQYLVNIVANQYAENSIRILLDAENYREKRKEALVHLAKRSADKAQKTGRKVILEPMPSYERKVIHTTLQKRSDIATASEGLEPNRYVVIEYKA